MSIETKKSSVEQLTSKGKLITFGIGALIGIIVFSFATNAASIAYQSSSLAIGNVTKSDQFTVGSWFRYDYGGPGIQPNQEFYIITNITSVTTAGNPILGDPLVASVIGNDAPWYSWNIKAYWMSGVEAISLYGKNDTGNVLWDKCGRLLFEGYSKRHTYTLAQATSAVPVNIVAVLRPQFVDTWKNGSVFMSNTSQFTTGLMAIYKLIAGIWMSEYNKQLLVTPNTYSIADYDPTSRLLTKFVFGDRVSSYAFALTQYKSGVRYIPVSSGSQVDKPDFSFVTGTDSTTGYITFSSIQTFRSWKVSVVSNNTSVVANILSTRFTSGPIPINATTVGTASINVTVIGDYFGVDSLPVSKIFTVIRKAVAPDRVNATVITSVDATVDSIKVGWTPVANASTYLVYANNTFVGQTGNTNFTFHPDTIGTYDIYVIVTSTIRNQSSVKSNVVSISYDLTSPLFNGTYTEMPPAVEQPTDYTAFIIITIVVIAGVVVSFVLMKQGIIPMPTKQTKTTSKTAIGSQKKPKTAPRRS